ncbi:OmpA family protein [Microbulbifer sp. CAU 1566]|uniref:OmpA family protein n=1 Tax=unclassified Microbulbifer TaxID=2619833 RepID=UPI00135A4B10|nr:MULTISPECIES: OmpA family protein [unclassified Microbulbifer]MCK7596447.1 OmpA family protein [Microbulbifer sp. CAU 1566]
MADNLLEMAVRHLGSSGLGALGSALGLPEGKSESAFTTGAASVLAGMLNKAGSESGLGALLNMATKSTSMDLSSPADIFSTPDKMTSLQDVGGSMLESLFGGKRDGVINAVAGALGLNSTKGGSLLRIAAPVIMSLIGKLVKSKGLNMEGLAALLLGQKAHVKDKLPPGLLQELGVKNLDELAERTVVETTPRQTAHTRTPPPVKKSGWGKWLWPLLIALGVLWALNMCAKKEKLDDGTGGVVMEQDEVVVTEEPATTDEPAVVEDDVVVAEEPVTSGDFGKDFRDYLANAQRDPNREFPLNIEFPTDGSMPNAASLPDVQALITVMQENPGLSIMIEGHTDSDGDAGANQKLSESRAQAVMKMLTDAGIDATRIKAVGVGSADPVASNDTEEGKQKNRRIVVKVTSFE